MDLLTDENEPGGERNVAGDLDVGAQVFFDLNFLHLVGAVAQAPFFFIKRIFSGFSHGVCADR